MKISEGDGQIIVGALDSLGVALAEHRHEWSVGERTIYEEAINVLTASSPSRTAADSTGARTCAVSQPDCRSRPASSASLGQLVAREYCQPQDDAIVVYRLASKLCLNFLGFFSYPIKLLTRLARNRNLYG